jgi:hypothetical protein
VRWLGDGGHGGKQRKADSGTYRRRNQWWKGSDKRLAATLYRRAAQGMQTRLVGVIGAWRRVDTAVGNHCTRGRRGRRRVAGADGCLED